MGVSAETELIVVVDDMGQDHSPDCNRNGQAREHPPPRPLEGHEHRGEYEVEMFFHGQRPKVTGVPVQRQWTMVQVCKQHGVVAEEKEGREPIRSGKLE